MQYMSPGQLEGREVDGRSDIFALGAILYEMASGRRAFDGSSRANVIAAIMHREPPPISTIQPLIPPAFEGIVRRCLAKDRSDRIQNAPDLALALHAPRDLIRSGEVPRPLRRTRLPLTLAAAAVVSVLITGSFRLAPRTSDEPAADETTTVAVL